MTRAPARRALIRLACTPGIGAVFARRLLDLFETPDAIFAASSAELASAGLPRSATAALAEPPTNAIEYTKQWLGEPNRHLIAAGEPDYPDALAELSAQPPWLYAIGDNELLARPAVAIVGSRNPTAHGRESAYAMARALAGSGLVIVSGLAEGIDAAAHQGALAANGMTIAVCGTGLDQVYPARNRALAETISERGLMLSEFALGTRPRRGNFPRRNRVIAGLSRATLVVEAARASGSLITARLAGELGRDVLAVPGSIHNPLARGCHQLIRDGAKLVETTEHVFEEIAPHLRYQPRESDAEATADAAAPDTTPHPLIEAMGHAPARVDDLVARTGWSSDAVSSSLLILELEGRIVATPGGAYLPAEGKQEHGTPSDE